MKITQDDIEITGKVKINLILRLPKTAEKFMSSFDQAKPNSKDYEIDKYGDRKKNPAYAKAKNKWDNRVKPFSFSI